MSVVGFIKCLSSGCTKCLNILDHNLVYYKEITQTATQQWAVIGPTCFTQRTDMGCRQRPPADVQLGNWLAQYTLRNDGPLSGR